MESVRWPEIDVVREERSIWEGVSISISWATTSSVCVTTRCAADWLGSAARIVPEPAHPSMESAIAASSVLKSRSESDDVPR